MCGSKDRRASTKASEGIEENRLSCNQEKRLFPLALPLCERKAFRKLGTGLREGKREVCKFFTSACSSSKTFPVKFCHILVAFHCLAQDYFILKPLVSFSAW